MQKVFEWEKNVLEAMSNTKRYEFSYLLQFENVDRAGQYEDHIFCNEENVCGELCHI